MSGLLGLWQYDIPRQSVKAFVLGLVLAIACGLIITFFWRIPPSQVESVEKTGQVEGRARGFAQGLRDGEEDGFFAARGEVDGLAATGTFGDGRELAFDQAWNDAIDRALEEASHAPVIQLRRITYWEALRR
ncbi:MAG: hypothetical protein F4Y69_10265 [Chloroflexi bacterium]|nr:hypothetical protein [Chloroflexota bacterium]MYF22900.1 hypothetical protein [Chloroflexota bacterium]